MSDFDDDDTFDDERPRKRGSRPARDADDARGASASSSGVRAPSKARGAAPRPADDDWDDEPASRSRRAPADDWDDDDWDDDDAGGRRNLSLILGIIAAVVVIALVVILTRPKDDKPGNGDGNSAGKGTATTAPQSQWQGPVNEDAGGVEARLAKEKGVFIWTDFDGWHVRNTTEADVAVTVAADMILEDKKEQGKSKTVTVKAGDGKSGLDIDLGFSEKATFTVKNGATAVAPAQIKLGGKTGEADANPVTFTKT